MGSLGSFLLENPFKILTGILTIIGLIITYLTYKRGNIIKNLEDEVEHLKKVNLDTTSKVQPEQDRKLIEGASESIQILGINALGIVHHCREELIKFLKLKQGIVQIMLLDPSDNCFIQREKREKDDVGRIRSEWNASIKIIKEILHKSEGRGKLELKLYCAPPTRSLLITDALKRNPFKGHMLINYYPEKLGTRGYEGGQFLCENALIRDKDSFEKNFNYFIDHWNKNKLEDVEELGNK